MIEMKKREVRKYPDSLTTASITLLFDSSLLNSFVKILFSKTKIHDRDGILCTLTITKKWFRRLIKNGEKVPSNFHFSFFFGGIKQLLKAPHLVIVGKTLWLIYKTFNFYHND